MPKPKMVERRLSLQWEYSINAPCHLCVKAQGRWTVRVKDRHGTPKLDLCPRHAEQLMYQLDEILYPRAARHVMTPRRPLKMESL